jgi:hypothetical protein
MSFFAKEIFLCIFLQPPKPVNEKVDSSFAIVSFLQVEDPQSTHSVEIF